MGDAVQETVDAVQDTEPDRWLQLEGLDNVRDAGGLPLRDGGRTRFGELLRSASLRYLTDDDVAHLVDVVGLRMVIDLRTAREIDRDGPTAVAARGVETVPLSFIPEEGTELPETGDDTDPLLRAYLGYLVDRTENVVHAVRLLGRPDAGPTLVHCAAGKDRTGRAARPRARRGRGRARGGDRRLRTVGAARRGDVPCGGPRRWAGRCPPTSPRTCPAPR